MYSETLSNLYEAAELELDRLDGGVVLDFEVAENALEHHRPEYEWA